MDISKWPLDDIMQLPNWCFGRRELYYSYVKTPELAYRWDIIDKELPDIMVIWYVRINSWQCNDTGSELRLVLSSKLPESHEEVMASEPLIRGFGSEGVEPKVIKFAENRMLPVHNLKLPIITAGRYIAVEASPNGMGQFRADVIIVASGVPKEIPDWLTSEQAKNQ